MTERRSRLPRQSGYHPTDTTIRDDADTENVSMRCSDSWVLLLTIACISQCQIVQREKPAMDISTLLGNLCRARRLHPARHPAVGSDPGLARSR